MFQRVRDWCKTRARGKCEWIWNGLMWLAFLGALLLSFATKQEVKELRRGQQCIEAKIEHRPQGPCGPGGRVIRLVPTSR